MEQLRACAYLRDLHGKRAEGRQISVAVPKGCEAELLLPPGDSTSLTALTPDHQLGLKQFQLEAGKENTFVVRAEQGASP
jgi:hypothetical protein